MREVWLLLQADYEEAEVLGVYSRATLAAQAQRVLWERYQHLTEEERLAVGSVGLWHEESLTWEAFAQWHPVVVRALDAVPATYTCQAEVSGADG